MITMCAGKSRDYKLFWAQFLSRMVQYTCNYKQMKQPKGMELLSKKVKLQAKLHVIGGTHILPYGRLSLREFVMRFGYSVVFFSLFAQVA